MKKLPASWLRSWEKEEDEIKELITQNQALVKVDKYLNKETADKIRDAELPGIEIAEDVKLVLSYGGFFLIHWVALQMTTPVFPAWSFSIISIFPVFPAAGLKIQM